MEAYNKKQIHNGKSDKKRGYRIHRRKLEIHSIEIISMDSIQNLANSKNDQNLRIRRGLSGF